MLLAAAITGSSAVKKFLYKKFKVEAQKVPDTGRNVGDCENTYATKKTALSRLRNAQG